MELGPLGFEVMRNEVEPYSYKFRDTQNASLFYRGWWRAFSLFILRLPKTSKKRQNRRMKWVFRAGFVGNFDSESVLLQKKSPLVRIKRHCLLHVFLPVWCVFVVRIQKHDCNRIPLLGQIGTIFAWNVSQWGSSLASWFCYFVVKIR